jgi:hypothetical protein
MPASRANDCAIAPIAVLPMPGGPTTATTWPRPSGRAFSAWTSARCSVPRSSSPSSGSGFATRAEDGASGTVQGHYIRPRRLGANFPDPIASVEDVGVISGALPSCALAVSRSSPTTSRPGDSSRSIRRRVQVRRPRRYRRPRSARFSILLERHDGNPRRGTADLVHEAVRVARRVPGLEAGLVYPQPAEVVAVREEALVEAHAAGLGVRVDAGHPGAHPVGVEDLIP